MDLKLATLKYLCYEVYDGELVVLERLNVLEA